MRVLVIASLVAGLLAAPAQAEDGVTTAPPKSRETLTLPEPSPLVPQVFRVPSEDALPPGFRITGRQAVAIAERQPAIRRLRAREPRLEAIPTLSALRLQPGFFWHWSVQFMRPGEKRILGEVEIGPDGRLYEVTTGVDVGWPLVKGYEGILGRALNAPYVWLPLCLLFLLPFLDFRRPLRLLHLDLLVLLAFGVSHYFFNLGKPWVSVPLVYPVLAYCVIRLAAAGFRPRLRSGPLIPHLGTRALAVLLGLLLIGRAIFGIAGSDVMDVGFAGVVGADRMAHGQELYVDNDLHPDTYGPVNYAAYIPFELALPYNGQDNDLTTAKVATLGFDALVVLGLLLLGRRLRPGATGTRLGLALAFGWAAYPYTTLVIAAGTNDALVPLFAIFALLLVDSAPGRAAMLGLGTMAKFAPAILAPAFAAGRRRLRPRSAAVFAAVYAAVCVAVLVPFIPDGGLKEFWNTTLGFQMDRRSPLSIWGRHPELEWLKAVLTVAVAAFAVSMAWWPRRRTVGQLAALAGAALAASQFLAGYWLYFYAAWFAPLLLVALFEEYRDLGPRSAQRDEVLREVRQPVRA